jgi:hypothetical protein
MIKDLFSNMFSSFGLKGIADTKIETYKNLKNNKPNNSENTT